MVTLSGRMRETWSQLLGVYSLTETVAQARDNNDNVLYDINAQKGMNTPVPFSNKNNKQTNEIRDPYML